MSQEGSSPFVDGSPEAGTGEGAILPEPTVLPSGTSAGKPLRKRWPRLILVILAVVGASAVAGFAWLVVGSMNEMADYERVEKLYSAPMNELMADKASLKNDAGAFILANRAKIAAARTGAAAAGKEAKSLDDSSNRSAYIESLSEVDAVLQVLEAMANSPDGAPGLAIKIAEAAEPMRTAEESVQKAFDGYRSKDYDAMVTASSTAVAEAKKTELALGALDKECPGLGIVDLRDYASALNQLASRVGELASACKTGDEPQIRTAETAAAAMDSKAQAAARRAQASVANALWSNPATALQDALRRLETARSAHAKVYNDIQEGN